MAGHWGSDTSFPVLNRTFMDPDKAGNLPLQQMKFEPALFDVLPDGLWL